jgi:hypothetical protein
LQGVLFWYRITKKVRYDLEKDKEKPGGILV